MEEGSPKSHRKKHHKSDSVESPGNERKSHKKKSHRAHGEKSEKDEKRKGEGLEMSEAKDSGAENASDNASNMRPSNTPSDTSVAIEGRGGVAIEGRSPRDANKPVARTSAPTSIMQSIMRSRLKPPVPPRPTSKCVFSSRALCRLLSVLFSPCMLIVAATETQQASEVWFSRLFLSFGAL